MRWQRRATGSAGWAAIGRKRRITSAKSGIRPRPGSRRLVWRSGWPGPELFEPVKAPLDYVAAPVDGQVERGRPTRGLALRLAARELVSTLRTGERHTPGARGPAGGGIRVGPVRVLPAGPAPRSTGPRPTHVDLIEQRKKLGVFTGLAGDDQDRHGQPAAIDSEVDLAGQPAPRASKPFALDRERVDPPGLGPPSFRAPAACWCARTEVESTENSHSTRPTASSFTTTSAKTRSQVPSALQRRSRSCAVLPGPIPLRQITPPRPRAQLPQDPIDHLTVITPLATTTATRQHRLDPAPTPRLSTHPGQQQTNDTSEHTRDPQDTP